MKRVALLICLSPLAFAQTQVPNVFEDGKPAKAAEVNANFDALETAIDNIGELTQGPQGPAGPQGPQGPPGSNASISGVAAGGDLSGSYPNPEIASGVVGPAEFGSIPAANVFLDGPTAVPDGDRTDVPLREAASLSEFDTADMVDGTNDRIVVPIDGIYRIEARMQWQGTAAPGRRQIIVTDQLGSGAGATDISTIDGGEAAEPTQVGSFYLRLREGTRLSVDVVQDTGSTQNLKTTSTFSVVWVGPRE